MAVFSAMAILLGVTTAAFADDLNADSDVLIAGVQNSANVGAVCLGTTTSKDVTLTVTRVGTANGNGPNDGKVFANNTTVTVTANAPLPAGLSVSFADSGIATGPGWAGVGNVGSTTSDTAKATLTRTNSALGPFSSVVTFTATGNKAPNGTLSRSTTFTLSGTVKDCTKPVLHVSGDQVVEATSAAGAVVNFTATADDIDPVHPVTTCTTASGSTFPIGVTTVTCSATDNAGNSDSASFTVTVEDTKGPVFGPTSNVTVEATAADGAVVGYTAPTAVDVVDGAAAVSCSPATTTLFALGTTTVTCTAADSRGNTSSATFSVIVQDTVGPVLGLPNPVVEATGPTGAVVNYVATAIDAVSGPVTPTCVPAPGTFALGDTTVSCTATDGNGNATSGSFVVKVTDTTKPDFGPIESKTAEATSADGAAVTFGPITATDLVDGPITPTCDATSGDVFPIGETTVTCTATDAHGNTRTATFTVTVEDTTAPTLNLPADPSVEATGADGAVVTYVATASDAVDPSPVVTCTPASGSTFPLGLTTVSCSATDATGNTSPTGTFQVEVKDTTAPTLNLPANQTTEATGPGGATATYVVTATDLVDPNPTVTCVPASGSTFPVTTTTVSCTAKDAKGNTSEPGTFTITVQDTTAPTLGTLGNKTVEATGPTGAVVTFSPSATDLVDPSPVVTCVPASGSTFALGTTTVTCTAKDASNNTSGPGTFTVTVQDTTGPTVTVPASMTVDPNGPTGATVTYVPAPSATDLVDGALAPTCTKPSGSLFAFGPTTVTCTATDAHGNTGSASFTVTVKGLTAKGFYQPVDMSTGTSTVYNTVKAGSTVPFKFEVFAGPTELTVTSAVTGFTSTVIACSTGAEDAVEEFTTTGNTSLRYDTTSGQFIQNWQTPKSAGACYKVTVTTGGGTTMSAFFKLK